MCIVCQSYTAALQRVYNIYLFDFIQAAQGDVQCECPPKEIVYKSRWNSYYRRENVELSAHSQRTVDWDKKKIYLRLRQRKTPLQESDQCAETCNTTKTVKLF